MHERHSCRPLQRHFGIIHLSANKCGALRETPPQFRSHWWISSFPLHCGKRFRNVIRMLIGLILENYSAFFDLIQGLPFCEEAMDVF